MKTKVCYGQKRVYKKVHTFYNKPVFFSAGYCVYQTWRVRCIPHIVYTGCFKHTVIADVIINAGEAFVKAISDTAKKKFSDIKLLFDITSVSASIILSLLFFDMKVVGAREGILLQPFSPS